jgi:S-adenosylmethionine hydrolase
MDRYRYITFLTDFGLQDDFVGVCHGVMARIAPDARVIDVTHGIAAQDVLQGGLVLANVLPYLPVAVHLAVVDPGVGGERRAIAIATTDGRTFVGPDNGLLTVAADACGIDAVHELTERRYHLDRVSRTFHARDVFAPVSAHIAAGVALAELGPPVEPARLTRIVVPEPEIGRTGVRATVVAIDRFGNIQLNLPAEHLDGDRAPGERVEIRLQLDAYFAQVAETFADALPGELIVYGDSYGSVSIALSNGNAAGLTGARPGDVIRISPARE